MADATKQDPICGMTGTIARHGAWFCSERCIAEFERRGQDASCRVPTRRWLFDPWVWAPLSGLVFGTIGWWWPVAAQVSALYRSYLSKMLVPFLLGLLIGGVIDHAVPREYIVRYLAGHRTRVIARSTLLGFLASSCSHGCLALTLELYRKGASTAAVVSFLLASPWASMPLTFMLVSLFGLKGFVIVGCALLIAFVTGLIFQQLALRGLVESNPNTVALDADFSVSRDLSQRLRAYSWTARQLAIDARGILAGMLALGRMVLGWLQLGLALSALAGGLVPHSIFGRFLGPSTGGLLLTLLIATVMEVCSEGTAPLAFELYRHTGALGNAFSFLMAGVVTDYTELGALWMNIGRRTVLWLLVVTLPLVVGIGLFLNLWRA